MEDRFQKVDDHFGVNLEEYNKYKEDVYSTFDEKEDNLKMNDKKIKHIFATLAAN